MRSLANHDAEDFLECYGTKKAVRKPALRMCEESERFRKFIYDEIVARDKAKLDIFWLKDESLKDSEKLQAILEEFRAVESVMARVTGKIVEWEDSRGCGWVVRDSELRGT